MSKELIVVKSNNFVEASYKLSLDEMRVLLLTLGVLDPDKPKREFEFTVADFASRFGVDEKIAYQQVSKAIDKLGGRWAIIEKTKKVERKVTFLTEQAYFKGEGRFQIILHEKLMPYISKLKGRFTRYNLDYVVNFSGFHSIRLYELMAQYRIGGEREISLTDLKDWLQISDKYPRYNNLKQWVIDPSIDEINEKSDLKVIYEPVKRGRKIVGLKFTIKPKKEAKTIKLPNKSSFGKYTKLDRQNPAMSSAEYASYAHACLKVLDDFYDDIDDVTNEHLRNYWVFLAVNASHKSKLGGKQKMLEELRKRGFKLVDCELVKIDEKQIDLVDDLKS